MLMIVNVAFQALIAVEVVIVSALSSYFAIGSEHGAQAIIHNGPDLWDKATGGSKKNHESRI